MRSWRIVTTTLAVLAFQAAGCTYTVRLLSEPAGAWVRLPDGQEVLTPVEATFRHGKRQLVRIEAPGYRPLVVDMQRTEGPVLRYVGGAVFQKGGREVMFTLVPDRGLIGEVDEGAE